MILSEATTTSEYNIMHFLVIIVYIFSSNLGETKTFLLPLNQTTQNQIFSAKFLGSRTSYSASSASAISLPVHTSTC